MKGKEDTERCIHINAEFQRRTRRDKKAFLGGQCKEIEENNRMGKTRDLFKKIRDTKARRSNLSILKEINPGYSLERMMLKLKHQYFGHLMQRVDSLEKTLMLGGIGKREKEKGTTEDEMAGWHH